MQLSRWISTTARVVFGAIVGIAALELGLRAFVTPGVPPRPDVVADSFDTEVVTRRQVDEGVATSHFSLAGARLTGNQPLRSLAPALILGDSHVEAEQVNDRETMGARLETLARGNGLSLDVRQFGWMGASPAEYLLVADDVRRRWQPLRVFIVLSANDFDHNALVLAQPRFRVEPDGELRIIGGPIPVVTGRAQGSVVLMLARHRWQSLGRRVTRWTRSVTKAPSPSVVQASAPLELRPDSVEYARVPGAVVRSLRDAYGNRLSLIYLADLGLREENGAGEIEGRFLTACAEAGVDCASTRDAMLAARQQGLVGHGAGVTPLGNGHLNPVGHDVVGRIMWDHLARDVRNGSGTLTAERRGRR